MTTDEKRFFKNQKITWKPIEQQDLIPHPKNTPNSNFYLSDSASHSVALKWKPRARSFLVKQYHIDDQQGAETKSTAFETLSMFFNVPSRKYSGI